jgi:uncharacterized protein
MSASDFTNHLIHEKSPYLLQHAHNPVDWYPWSNEAFEKAKQLDRPIFLSIGYATCHWCHVMEKESFENREIAQLMNEAFINIKVDREELPEVDSIYMDFAQALMASAAGWPLNLVLTPDLKPFFAMTYLPAATQRGLIGMTHFVQHIQQLWNSDEKKMLIEQADRVVELFESIPLSSGNVLPEESLLDAALEVLYELIDPVYGGIKGEPKFPMGYQSALLLNAAAIKGDSRALFCAELSLSNMQRGGIYDQLGGGFARYAVDEAWLIPHFEKMLYDNAILAATYLDAWRYTKKLSYQNTCQETLNYILRVLFHEGGGYYSAEDADSDGHEGLYYTWDFKEISTILSAEELELFCSFYGVKAEGNFEGRTILHSIKSVEEFAEDKNLNKEEIKRILEIAKSKLLNVRKTRVPPFVDDKILTSWNGLMIDAMMKAARCFNIDTYEKSAIQTAEFIRSNLWKEGQLLRRFRENEPRFVAGLDDYAFLIKGLLTLFDHDCGTEWLKFAVELAEIVENQFKTESGAYYLHLKDPSLLLRKCEFYDGAEPSGNAVHSENLLRLYQITYDEKYLRNAQEVLKAAKGTIETYPPGACYHLLALYRYLNIKAATVVIALDEEGSLQQEIKTLLYKNYLPHVEVIWKREKDTLLTTLIPSLVDKKPIDGQTAVYICRQNRCQAPLIHKEQIEQALDMLIKGHGG